MATDVCLYHGSDLDGHCSGAIYSVVAQEKGLDYVLYPIDYGDPIPWDLCKGANVAILDFSIQPWHDFQKFAKAAKSVLWIDHHSSAISEYEEKGIESASFQCRLDVTKAACELVWEHFNPDLPMARGVKLLGRYDVWDHSDPDVLPYQYGMRLFDMDPKSGKDQTKWIDVLTGDTETAIEIGKILLKYQRKQDAEAVSKAWFPVEFGGRTWQACNRLGKGSSFFDSVADSKQYDGVLSFSFNGKIWTIGLYSDRDDVDCGAIAKSYGGGGHKGAAGLRCDTLPFVLPEGAVSPLPAAAIKAMAPPCDT